MPDKTIICANCKTPFVWTVGEQRFYEQKRHDPPRRCKACIAARNATQTSGTMQQRHSTRPMQQHSRFAPTRPRSISTLTQHRQRPLRAWASAYWRYGLILGGAALLLTLIIALALRLAFGEA